MGELIGLCLMPAYAICCWTGLYKNGGTGKHLLPAALFGWIWAIINIMRSKRIDLGIVTFGLVIIFTLVERYYGFTRGVRWAISASCLAVAANFSLVVIFWKPIQKDLSKSKSQLWLKVFLSYCVTLMIFWIVAAFKNFVRGEENSIPRLNNKSKFRLLTDGDWRDAVAKIRDWQSLSVVKKSCV